MSNRYEAPIRDMQFALYDVLGVDRVLPALGHEETGRELVDAVLEEAARFAGTVLAPLNEVGDREGCSLDKATGEVKTRPASGRPTSSTWKAAGPASPRRPRSAARGCRTWSASCRRR